MQKERLIKLCAFLELLNVKGFALEYLSLEAAKPVEKDEDDKSLVAKVTNFLSGPQTICLNAMAARRSQLLESPTSFVAPTGVVFGVNMDEAYYILKQKTVSQLFHFKRISCSACQDAHTHLRTAGGRGQELEAQHGVCGQETEPSWHHCSPGAHQRSNGTCSLCTKV